MADQSAMADDEFPMARGSSSGRPSDFDSSLGIIPVENMSDLGDSIFKLDSSEPPDSQPSPSLGATRAPPTKAASKNLLGIAELLPSKVTVSEFGMVETQQSRHGIDEFQSGKSRNPEMGMFLGAFAGVSEDAETSFHEICFDAEELDQFDMEFSDLGDSDHTITDDVPEGDEAIFQGTKLEDISMPRDISGFDPMSSAYSNLEAELPNFNNKLFNRESGILEMERPSDAMEFDLGEGHCIGEGQEDVSEQSPGSLLTADHLGILESQFFKEKSKGPEDTTDVDQDVMQTAFKSNVRRESSLFADSKADDIGPDDKPRSSNIFGDTQDPGEVSKIFGEMSDFTSGNRLSDMFGEVQKSSDRPSEAAERHSNIFGDTWGPPAGESDNPFDQKPQSSEADIRCSSSSAESHTSVAANAAPAPVPPLKNTPVYITEDGEGVTDLAYCVPLDKVTQNPFESPQTDVTDDDEDFGEENFKSADQMLDQLDADEQNFAKENIFREDDAMVQSTTPDNTFSQNVDSWAYRSAFLMSNPSSAEANRSYAPYMRISIGTFMHERTEVLGSLTGDNDRPRPTFGSKIVTPPGNRRPVALFAGHPSPQKSPSRAPLRDQVVRGSGVGSDVDADGFEHGDGVEDTNSPQPRDCTLTTDDLVTPSPIVKPKNDLKFHDHIHHPTLAQIRESVHEDSRYSQEGTASPQVHSLDSGATADHHKSDNSLKTEGQDLLLANELSCTNNHPCNRDNKISAQDVNSDIGPSNVSLSEMSEKKVNRSAYILDSSDLTRRTPSPGLETSDINLSTITKLVTGKSAAGDEEDLVGAIMKMSQAKVMAKQNHRDRRKAAMESNRASSDSSDIDSVQESPRSRNKQRNGSNSRMPNQEPHRVHASGPVDPIRRPADGKAAQQQDASTGQIRRGSQSDTSHKALAQSKRTTTDSDSDSAGLPVRNTPRGQAGDRRPVGRHSGIPQPGRRSGASGLTKSGALDSRKGSSSSEYISESRRNSGSTSDSFSRKGSMSSLDQRRSSVTKIPVKRKSSIEEVPLSVKDSLPVCEKSEVVEKPSQTKALISGTSLPGNVLTKEALAQLHKLKRKEKQDGNSSKEAIAKYDNKTDSESDLGSTSESELKWKSPRPSSVLTRSQRQSSDSEADRAKKSQAWWDDPDRTPIKKGTTAPRKVQFQHEHDLSNRHLCNAGSTDSSRSNSPHHDLETPPILESLKNKGVEMKWLSSTPKDGVHRYGSQESLSQIVTTPKNSFSMDYSDPTLGASQDNTAKYEPKTLQNRNKPQEISVMTDKPAGKDFPANGHPVVQVTCSTGSPGPGEKFHDPLLFSQQQSFGDTLMKPAQLSNYTTTSTAFASQFLASSTNSTALPPSQPDNDCTLKRSTGQGFALNRVPQAAQGVFKVPQLPAHRVPPAVCFDDRPSLQFTTTQTTIQEESIVRLSASPHKHTALSENKENELKPFPPHLLEVRESLPGPPSNHSTPLMPNNRSQLGLIVPQTNRESFMPDFGLPEKNAQKSWGHPDLHSQSFTVDAPTDVRIPGVCCIGLSTQGCIPLHNPSQRWLHVHLELITLSFDGEDHNIDGAVPFVLKEKLFLEPGKSEDVTVVFVPRQAGAYVAQLRLVVSPVVAEQTIKQVDRVPRVITIQAVSEKPVIQVLTGGSRNFVDFGALPWGCQKGMPVTLINKGRANIPVRLVISSNNSAWQCFTFERYPSPDVSVVSNQSRPPLPSLVPTICNHVLPSSESDTDIKPVQVVLYFKAPPRHFDRGMMTGAPEDFCGRVMIEVDTPSKLITLGSVELTATVGTARLHTPTDMEIVSFKTQNGTTNSRVIPLRNAGNIPIEVSMEVTHWPDFFTVVPMQTMMEPGGQSEVIVKFEPTETAVTKFESLLLMFVEPDGPSYEIQLQGEVCVPPPLPSYQDPPRAPMLLSNKHHMAWGGVSIGKSKEQRLTLKNSADQMIKLILQIRGKTTDFQLQSSFGQKSRLSTSKEVLLRPLEEYPVHVVYSPTSAAWAEAKLQIKQSCLPLKYTIPLTGYGGISQLKLDGVNSNKQNYCWKALGHLTPGKSIAVTITVHNHGNRAAFVKAICFQDLACKRKLKLGLVAVDPNEFCLRENESRQVTLVATPTEREVSMCMNKAGIVSSVAFFYGDELSRQLYRISIRKSKKCPGLADDNPLKGVDFNVSYLDDDRMCDGYDLKDSPANTELFYSSMSRLSLALVGSPPASPPVYTTPVPPITAVPPQAPSSLSLEQKTSKTDTPVARDITKNSQFSTPASPPVRDTDKNSVPAKWELEEIEWWTLRPEELVLSAPHKGASPAIRKLQITNYTDKQMTFELYWPGHCVSVSPEEGIVPARNFVIICVSASPHLHQRGVKLPWNGKIHVTCNKENKALKVLIQEEGRSGDPEPLVTMPTTALTPIATISPQKPKPVVPMIVMSTSNKKSSLDLSKTSQQLEFSPTIVKSESHEHLEIRNTQPFPIKWTVSSFTPPYLKSPDDSTEISRVPYAVFWLPRQSGSLDPHQRIQAVPDPLNVLKVTSGDHNSHMPADNSGKSQVLSKDQLLIIRPDVLKFHTSSPGDSSQSKVQLRNRSQDVEMLEFLPPEEPFRIKFEKISVKMLHYMRVPVDFRPKKSGIYHGTLKMQRPSGEIIDIKLEGVCG